MGRVAGSVWLSGLVAFLALFVLSAAWSIATPLAASPDEPSHIIKAAAVVRGELTGTPLPESGYTGVRVPSAEGDAWLWTCSAFRPNIAASCQGTPAGSAEEMTAKTSAGLYNPLYYALVGWPSLVFTEPHAVVYSMRLLTALLCSALLAVAIGALFLFRAPIVTAVAAFAMATPTTMFLSGSVNPNALEIAAGAALLALLLVLVRAPEVARPRTLLVLIAVVSVLLASTRALSPLWMLAIAAIALVAAVPGRLHRLAHSVRFWVMIGVIVIGVLASVAWTAKAGILSGFGHFPGTDNSPFSAFVAMVLDRSFDPGMLALFGWLDTPAQPVVLAIWTFLAVPLALGAVIMTRGRMLAAVLTSIGVYLLIPALVQASSIRQSGFIWQGRYALIAYAGIMVTSAVAIGISRPAVVVPPALLRRGLITVASLAAGGQAFAVAGALRRYAVGANGTWQFFLTAPKWQAPGSNILWIVVALVGAGLLSWLLVARAAVVSAEPIDPVTPRTEDKSVSTGSPEYRAEVH